MCHGRLTRTHDEPTGVTAVGGPLGECGGIDLPDLVVFYCHETWVVCHCCFSVYMSECGNFGIWKRGRIKEESRQ